MSQDKNLWDQTWSGLMMKFGNNFQLQVPFSVYNWPDPKPGYISYKTYDLFNERPLWSAVRNVGSTGLYGVYGTVIQFAPSLVPTLSQQKELADFDMCIERALDVLHKDQNTTDDEFQIGQKQAQAQGKVLEFSAWLVESGWANIIQLDREKMDALQTMKANLPKNDFPDNKKYITAYTPPPQSAVTTDKAFLKCTIKDIDIWRATYTAPTPNIIVKMAIGGPKLTMLLDSTDASHATDKSWAHLDINDPFFSTYNDHAWTKSDLAVPGESVRLEITHEKIDKYPIGMGTAQSMCIHSILKGGQLCL